LCIYILVCYNYIVKAFREKKEEILMKGMTIRVKRVRAGLSQSELAKRIGLTQALVSQIETGFYVAGPELVKRINKALQQHKER
jgi:predicted transcriptional regulator